MKTSFLLEDKYGVMIERLSREEAGDLLKAIYRYRRSLANVANANDAKQDLANVANANDGSDGLSFAVELIFALIKEGIDEAEREYQDTCLKRREAGRRGGKAKANNAKQDLANVANANDANEEKEREDEREKEREEKERSKEKEDKEKEKGEEKEIKKEKEPPKGGSKKKAVRHRHGEFQNVLLTDEDYATLQELFPLDCEDRIEKLSRGKYQKGYKYKSDYIAILDWAERDGHYKAGDAQIARKKAMNKSSTDDDDDVARAKRTAYNLKQLKQSLSAEEFNEFQEEMIEKGFMTREQAL